MVLKKDTLKTGRILMNQILILWALEEPSDFESVNPFTEINFQVKFPKNGNKKSSVPAIRGILFYTSGTPASRHDQLN